MTKAILVSPAPVDGYPPVQHQARMLADAGIAVDLLTTPLLWADKVEFEHQRVVVRPLRVRGRGKAAAFGRAADFVSAIAAARYRCQNQRTVEIVYDPLGMLYSDMAPFRTNLRIAHFHECLQRFRDAWLESRLVKSIKGYQMVVVADWQRAAILHRQLALKEAPAVAPNYPMAERGVKRMPKPSLDGSIFDVVYCGSVGLDQKLDFIIESVHKWPERALFSVIGNDQSPLASQLRQRARELGIQHRVRFEGWISYRELPSRLARADLGIALLDPTLEQWSTALGASNKRYQYMQAGLPQISDMNPGVAELLELQQIGRSLTQFSICELASLVTEYAGNPERGRSEGERAFLLHLERYNYQRAFQPVLDWIVSMHGQLPARSTGAHKD